MLDVVLYLWYCYVMLHYYPIVLVKSYATVFFYDEKGDFPEVVSWRDMVGMARCGVNYWLIDIPIGWGITVRINKSLRLLHVYLFNQISMKKCI
jgi:hypothetical protein